MIAVKTHHLGTAHRTSEYPPGPPGLPDVRVAFSLQHAAFQAFQSR